MPGLGPVAYMSATKLLVGLLGIVLAFSNTVFYDYSWAGHRMGMTPLEDQNVAGLFMALEQSIVMGIALAWLFIRMLGESQRSDERAERYEPAG